MYLATLSAGRFTFTALGESPSHAKGAIAAAWEKHVAETGADPRYVHMDDVNVAPIGIGDALRDHETFFIAPATCSQCGETVELADDDDPESWIHADGQPWDGHTAEFAA